MPNMVMAQTRRASQLDPIFTIAIILHVLPAVFWAGSTFVLARGETRLAATLYGPMSGASGLAFLVGAFLWFRFYGFSFGSHILAFGILCAIIAAGVQGAMVGRNREGVLAGDPTATATALRGNRIAAALLVVTLITMVIN